MATNALQLASNLGWQVAVSRLVATTAPLIGMSTRILVARCRTGNCRTFHQTASPNRVGVHHQLSYTNRRPHCRTAIGTGAYSICSSEKPRLLGTRAFYSTAANSGTEPIVKDVFEKVTGTWQYMVTDPATKTTAIIDPVLDYAPATRCISTTTADALLFLVKQKGYKVSWILETHAHADHLTAASYLQKRLTQEQGEKPSIGIGKRIGKVQSLFGKRYGILEEEYTDVFDKLFDDDEMFTIGELKATAMHLPGHTPDHMGYRIGDNVFCGDSIFNADIGTARCDFPGGNSHQLYMSGRKLLSLPDHVKIWTGHDYPPEGGRDPLAFMTVREHKEKNKHLREGIEEDEFVAMRNERDAGLGAPRLLHQSLQNNIRAGHLPKPTKEHGDRLFHIPVKVKGGGGVGGW